MADIRFMLRRSLVLLRLLLFVALVVLTAVPELNAQRVVMRGNSRFYNNTVSRRLIEPLAGQRQAPVSIPVDNSEEYASSYDVGQKNISWRYRGVPYSAVVFHPRTPPVAGETFPLVIFSHGLGSSAESLSYLGRSWAQRGMVVVMLRHPESDESIWRGKLRPMENLKEAYRKCWSGRDRANAIRGAIDFAYSVHKEEGPMGRDLDLSRIAVAGNDLGALAALMTAGQLPPDNGASLKDPRVSMVIAISPPVFCEAAQGFQVYGSIDVPLLVVTGTNDDGVVGTTKAWQRRVPYDSVHLNDRYLLTLNGADHRVYGGLRIGAKQRSSDAAYQETIRQETTDCLSAYLLGDEYRLYRMREQGCVDLFANAQIEHRVAPAPENAAKTYTVGAFVE